MSKPASESDPRDKLSFEEAMEQLEEIARRLEDGDLGLGDSLTCYEQGIGYLKHCHAMLREAEGKISLLTGVGEGNSPVAESFSEEEMTLEEKQGARARRRSQRKSPPDEPPPSVDMDIQPGLF